MSRRFLTAEDVRRASGGEIVVDEHTVVTPQAIEAAQARGLSIRSGSGAAWAPAAPDRGPDARVVRSHPALPEPHDADREGVGLVVTAVGRNRPGVLAEITGALGESGCSIHDISQKMVEGYFHMILTVELPAGVAFDQLKNRLECLGGEDDYVVRAMHERVFRFMHRV